MGNEISANVTKTTYHDSICRLMFMLHHFFNTFFNVLGGVYMEDSQPSW